MDIATTEAEVRRNREKLNRLLGLWGPDTDWRIAGELPDLPASDFPISGLERLAISQRLDLQADYLELTSQAKNLGLTKSFRLVGALDFGAEIERETDTQIRTGPTFAIELPIFNQGQARIAKGEAALEQALGMMGMFIIHPRTPESPRPDRDFTLMSGEWRIDLGTMRPNPIEMTDFNILTFNGRAFPGMAGRNSAHQHL